MLTADLVKPRLKARGNSLHIEMLDGQSQYWQRSARDLIQLFQAHLGQSLGTWEQALSDYEGERLDYDVLRGLAKVLVDEAQFRSPAVIVPPSQLREQLFQQGPAFEKTDLFHPKSRTMLLTELASIYGMTAAALEATLYADRVQAQVLESVGQEWSSTSLLQRYNLELARAALYWSPAMRVWIYDGFKDFWRYVKLFKLMFEARPIEGGYFVQLDGPISPFVQATTRYGRQFAAFLPALFLLQKWQLEADIRLPQLGKDLRYSLNEKIPLVSHFKRSPLYDSRFESDFAAEFYSKFGDKRGKWELEREAEVLLLGDTVMIPDFRLRHRETGQVILLEIMGFWHPAYLERKLRKVREAKRENLLLLVYEGVNLTGERLQDLPAEVLYFKQKPVLKELMEVVESLHGRLRQTN
jgi:predicted nuclease of restriction endonuclease-like RecB superfamily